MPEEPSAPAASLANRAFAGLLIGAVLIGLSAIFVRLSEVGPLATAFARAALALPVLWAWAWLANRRQGSALAHAAQGMSRRKLQAGLILAGLYFAGDLAMFHWAVTYTAVANAVLIANLAPIIVTAFAVLFIGERVTRTFLAGCALATLGTAVLMGDRLTLSPDQVLGDLAALGAACFYAAYLIAVRRLRQHIDTASIMAWSTSATAIALIPLALAEGGNLWPVTLFGWSMLFGLAWVCHAGGQGLIAYALAHLPASYSAVNLLLQPVLSTIFAWVILAETLGPWQAAGASCVLAGLWVANVGRRANPRATASRDSGSLP
jgi:drug/metabolite transporter (DMT)-like permease